MKATSKRVDEAVKLMSENKYYEANLALKATEDGLSLDTVLLVDPGQAGSSASSASSAKPAK